MIDYDSKLMKGINNETVETLMAEMRNKIESETSGRPDEKYEVIYETLPSFEVYRDQLEEEVLNDEQPHCQYDINFV